MAGALAPIQWFIPVVVTIGGTLISKFTPGSWLPEGPPPTPEKATLRTWAGMASDGGGQLEGNMPGFTLYDELGWHWGGMLDKRAKIPQGSFKDAKITPGSGNNRRPSYLQMDAWQNDAICVAGVHITYPDDHKAMMYFDAAVHICGWPGYPSITDFPLPGVGSSGYHPACAWMDGDNSYDHHFPRAIAFHIPDFDAKNLTVDAYNANNDLFCASDARLAKYDTIPGSIPYFKPPLTYNPDEVDIHGKNVPPTHLDPKRVLNKDVGKWPRMNKWHKRGMPVDKAQAQRAKRNETRVEARWTNFDSVQDTLSADYICSKLNIVGPHFANKYEKRFCSMVDRTVWPFCENGNFENCWDNDQGNLWGPAEDVSAEDASVEDSSLVERAVGSTNSSKVDAGGRRRAGRNLLDLDPHRRIDARRSR